MTPKQIVNYFRTVAQEQCKLTSVRRAEAYKNALRDSPTVTWRVVVCDVQQDNNNRFLLLGKVSESSFLFGKQDYDVQALLDSSHQELARALNPNDTVQLTGKPTLSGSELTIFVFESAGIAK